MLTASEECQSSRTSPAELSANNVWCKHLSYPTTLWLLTDQALYNNSIITKGETNYYYSQTAMAIRFASMESTSRGFNYVQSPELAMACAARSWAQHPPGNWDSNYTSEWKLIRKFSKIFIAFWIVKMRGQHSFLLRAFTLKKLHSPSYTIPASQILNNFKFNAQNISIVLYMLPKAKKTFFF